MSLSACPGDGSDAPRRGLTTINAGMGRDSTAMLCLLAEGLLVADGAPVLPSDIDAVIFSDTGAEWPSTYAALPAVRALCKRMGVRFLHLQKPPEAVWRAHLRPRGDRSDPAWVLAGQGLSIEEKADRGAYHRRLPILEEFSRFAKIAVTQNASCTDNHKVQVIRRAMNDLCVERFGMDCQAWGRLARKGLAERHRVLIGIAADEIERAIDTGRPFYERACYPLVEMDIGKVAEVPILDRHGFGWMHKSGCYICPFQPVGWYWVLSVRHPDLFARVVAYEAAALAANPKMFVVAGKPLELAVHDWRRRNPHAAEDDVLAKAYCRGTAGWAGVGKRPEQLSLFAPRSAA